MKIIQIDKRENTAFYNDQLCVFSNTKNIWNFFAKWESFINKNPQKYFDTTNVFNSFQISKHYMKEGIYSKYTEHYNL